MAYSNEKKKEIEDLIEEGKKAKEIAEITGVSISTVYRIKKDMKDNSVELNDTLTNDNIPEEKISEKMKLMEMAKNRKDYKTAEELAQEILDDEGISAEDKAVAKNQLITIAINKKDYARGKELAGEILDDEEVSTKQKSIAKNQLIRIAINKKDYARGKELAGEILDDEGISAEDKAVAKNQLIKIAKIEKDYARAKELAGEIIDDEGVSSKAKTIAKSQLITIAIREKDYARGKEIAREILDDGEVSTEQKTVAKNQLIKIERKEKVEEKLSKQNDKYTRKRLYAGKIPVDDLKEIVERNSETLRGCLFIAEAYKYFKAEDLGIKWLSGYKRKNPDMPASDKKAIAGAMDILNAKRPVATGMLQKQWDDVYSRLQSKTALEGHSDDEDQR